MTDAATPESWHIRKATASDADALAACIKAAYAVHVERIKDLPDMASGCVEDIATEQVWVAVLSGHVIGGLVLGFRPGFLLLANVAIHPDHQGLGLGRAFMDLAEQEATNHGFATMRLNTHVAMQGNIDMYRKRGWREINRTANTVSMQKTLVGAAS